MAKHKQTTSEAPSRRANPTPAKSKAALWVGVALAVIGLAKLAQVWHKWQRAGEWPPRPASNIPTLAAASPATASGTDKRTNAPAALPTMPINEAVMVTVELDFGPKIPAIAEALQEIERRYQPDEGTERTFAILDAYGEPTPDGQKLHLSMHVSTERLGGGSLIFKRTGKELWSSRIVPSTNTAKGAFTGKDLKIYFDDGANRLLTVDGSTGPSSILDATVKELSVPVATAWPDGATREVTFIYSACGCPVKAMVKRVGHRTMRTKELPVMFPDDPTVMTFITRLMRW